jgi:hypothetical protein
MELFKIFFLLHHLEEIIYFLLHFLFQEHTEEEDKKQFISFSISLS